MQIIFLLALPVLMYFLLIRPQQRRVKQQRELLAQVEEGDEVMTTGGIYGFVNAVQDDTIWLDIAEGVEVRIARASIARRIPAGSTDVPDSVTGHEVEEAAAEVEDTTDDSPPSASTNGTTPKPPTDAAAEDTPKAGPEAER